MSDRHRVVLHSSSAEETENIGELLGRQMQSGDVLCLVGDLGAGKTCLTRGLARGWGSSMQPTSPTFTLVNEYYRSEDSQLLYHMDCYRLSGAAEAQTTALDDMLDADGVLVIEWPERILESLPEDRLWVQILDRGGDTRKMIFEATGKKSSALLQALGTE